MFVDSNYFDIQSTTQKTKDQATNSATRKPLKQGVNLDVPEW